ncbi:MAG: hypothetical protein ACR2M5_01395 [Nakamurella sp.]
MSGRRASDPRSIRSAFTLDSSGPTVTVCRDCCCGTTSKHPDVDHDGQLRALPTGIEGAGQVKVSKCLDACERSNVVVVTPSPAGRRAGARPVWLEGVLDEEATAQVVQWATAGGPGVSDPPGLLDLQAFTPSRRARQAVRR